MAKTIKVTPKMEEKIVAFCKDELNYHIHESGCPEEYKDECDAEIFLLKSLGYEDDAAKFKEEFKEATR